MKSVFLSLAVSILALPQASARTLDETRAIVHSVAKNSAQRVHTEWYMGHVLPSNPRLGEIDPQGGRYYLRDFTLTLRLRGFCQKNFKMTGVGSSTRWSMLNKLMAEAITSGSARFETISIECK